MFFSQAFPDEYLTQVWDHDDSGNTNTFQQRFWSNDEFNEGPGSPAFLMIGGEGEGSSGWLTSGQW